MGIAACGETMAPFVKLFPKATVAGLFDNDKKIHGKKIFGVSVQPIAAAGQCQADIIVVCTLNQHNAQQLRSQLAAYVKPERLITFFD